MASTNRSFLVRPLGSQDNQVYDSLSKNARVKDLKERIFVAQGIPVEEQKLIYVAEVMDSQPSFNSNR